MWHSKERTDVYMLTWRHLLYARLGRERGAFSFWICLPFWVLKWQLYFLCLEHCLRPSSIVMPWFPAVHSSIKWDAASQPTAWLLAERCTYFRFCHCVGFCSVAVVSMRLQNMLQLAVCNKPGSFLPVIKLLQNAAGKCLVCCLQWHHCYWRAMVKGQPWRNTSVLLLYATTHESTTKVCVPNVCVYCATPLIPSTHV